MFSSRLSIIGRGSLKTSLRLATSVRMISHQRPSQPLTIVQQMPRRLYSSVNAQKPEIPKRVNDIIANAIKKHDVVLFMKGTPGYPMCGFSRLVVQALQLCGVENYHAIDVLADDEVRNGIKAFSDWPTIPQLYVRGEFIGGADIVRQMYESGELKKLVQAPQSEGGKKE